MLKKILRRLLKILAGTAMVLLFIAMVVLRAVETGARAGFGRCRKGWDKLRELFR